MYKKKEETPVKNIADIDASKLLEENRRLIEENQRYKKQICSKNMRKAFINADKLGYSITGINSLNFAEPFAWGFSRDENQLDVEFDANASMYVVFKINVESECSATYNLGKNRRSFYTMKAGELTQKGKAAVIMDLGNDTLKQLQEKANSVDDSMLKRIGKALEECVNTRKGEKFEIY